MKSTELHPLAYFEYVIDTENIVKEIENEFLYSDYLSIDLGDLIEINYVEQNNSGEFLQKSILAKDLLTPKLYREFQNAKSYLYNFCINSTKLATENYLRIQVNILQTILTRQSDLINKHIYLLLPIRGILRYINETLLLPEMTSFELDEIQLTNVFSHNAEQIQFNSIKKSDIDIIHSVLDYLKGNNQKREKILSDEDFEVLIKYTKELIQQEEVPVITKQLHPKISNDLIRFTYWALHKELYTTTTIRNYFYAFVKAVFLNFKESEISSIKSLFGTQKRVPKDNFLPEVISKYIK